MATWVFVGRSCSAAEQAALRCLLAGAGGGVPTYEADLRAGLSSVPASMGLSSASVHTRCCHKGAFLVVASSWPSWCGAERTCGLPHQSRFTPQGPSTEKGGGPGKLSMPPTPTSPSLSALLPRPNRGRPLSRCPLWIVGLCRQQPFFRTPSVGGQGGWAQTWSRAWEEQSSCQGRPLSLSPVRRQVWALDRLPASPRRGWGQSRLRGRTPPRLQQTLFGNTKLLL